MWKRERVGMCVRAVYEKESDSWDVCERERLLNSDRQRDRPLSSTGSRK